MKWIKVLEFKFVSINYKFNIFCIMIQKTSYKNTNKDLLLNNYTKNITIISNLIDSNYTNIIGFKI